MVMVRDAAAVATLDGNPGRANSVFVKLTMTPCCDIVAGHAESVTRRDEPVSGDLCQPKQRRTAKEQRTLPLFLRPPNRRRPRISAEKEMSPADNLPQKQQKQREVACAVQQGPLALCSF